MQALLKLKSLHPAQRQILNEAKRFNVLKCGRRFGKTELTKELAIETMLDGLPVAYYCPIYKDLVEVWNEMKSTLYDITTHKEEQIKSLTIITGGKLDCWSMDDPNSGRGRKYKRVIVDEAEKSKNLKDAWEQTIRATLVDYEGDAWFMSTPKFGETYFKETLFKQKEKLNDWMSWRFTSFDNPFLSADEINEARNLLDEATFECEYMANDVDRTDTPFATQWNNDKHISEVAIYDPRKQLIISIDFNLVPFCVTFRHFFTDDTGQHYHVFDEAEIKQGSIPAMIELIKLKYKASLSNAILTGDAMGNRGDISQRDNASLYLQLLRGLGMTERQLKVSNNPTHENSRSDCNYVLYHFPDYKINPNCKGLIRDMRNVQVDATGAIIKGNRKDVNQRADYIDTERYAIHNIMYNWIDQNQKRNNNFNIK